MADSCYDQCLCWGAGRRDARGDCLSCLNWVTDPCCVCLFSIWLQGKNYASATPPCLQHTLQQADGFCRNFCSAWLPPRRDPHLLATSNAQVRVWKSGNSTRADSYFEGVKFPRTQGGTRISQPGDSCNVNRAYGFPTRSRLKEKRAACRTGPRPKKRGVESGWFPAQRWLGIKRRSPRRLCPLLPLVGSSARPAAEARAQRCTLPPALRDSLALRGNVVQPCSCCLLYCCFFCLCVCLFEMIFRVHLCVFASAASLSAIGSPEPSA